MPAGQLGQTTISANVHICCSPGCSVRLVTTLLLSVAARRRYSQQLFFPDLSIHVCMSAEFSPLQTADQRLMPGVAYDAHLQIWHGQTAGVRRYISQRILWVPVICLPMIFYRRNRSMRLAVPAIEAYRLVHVYN